MTRALNIYRQPLLRSRDLLTIEEWRSELDRETAEAVRRSSDARIETRWSHTEMGHAYRRGCAGAGTAVRADRQGAVAGRNTRFS